MFIKGRIPLLKKRHLLLCWLSNILSLMSVEQSDQNQRLNALEPYFTELQYHCSESCGRDNVVAYALSCA